MMLLRCLLQVEQYTIELLDLRKILDDFMTETSARITNIMEDVVSLTDVMKINLKCLEDDIALVKKSIPTHLGAIGIGFLCHHHHQRSESGDN
ncbi:hypothetical protein F0562_035401 [Nyssa sinensis]|uniref:Rx N-terminal domain-containing protein n=1 Tax=Nyssa sinensis TaxID=561372 RepID=A0A5J5AB13_9ASTE|nr:hypothetical protein F0562_035401 [Nyssa sinensis]